MTRARVNAKIVAVTILSAGALVAAGCGSGTSKPDSGGSSLTGDITIDGSSTVEPLASAAAEAFNADNSDVNIDVRASGTGGGFAVFCKGETDISDASRTIKDEEAKACAAKGIKYEALRVASDGITLVTGSDVDVSKTCLTFADLEKIWKPGSTVKNWSAIGPGFANVELKLAGPGSQSGTYDFFNETILGKGADGKPLPSRQDYAASEDDNVTVNVVNAAKAGLGYFGFSYFEQNQDTLTPFAVDGGKGCVAPSSETITDGSYPLSRPLFIYVKMTSLAKPEVKAFVRYFLANAIGLAKDQQLVPATQAELDAGLKKVPA